MVNGRDADVYRGRAHQWRLEAEKWPPGHQYDACVALAEGYEKLKRLIEKSETPISARRAQRRGNVAGRL